MMRTDYDEALVAEVAANLDLRKPNAEALKTVAFRVNEHFAASDQMYEGTIDVATGVGKTYVLAGVVDYFTALGGRNFAVIAPGSTVARKTIANFTPGHAKSLLEGMDTQPMVVTADNFDSPIVAAALEDQTIAKLYIFTVQALLTPTKKADRRTHEFQENLGAGFYARLQSFDDLVLVADESHTYGGAKFAQAVSGLHPRILLGLTATPDKDAKVVFRYPLAAAIAEGYVKTPVIVGRADDRDDTYTKLFDGVRLLEGKQRAVVAYREQHPDAPQINPVMLVLAADTDMADEVEGILKHPNFAGGAYADAILTVHSKVSDADKVLALLDAVEDPDSTVRIIVSVGMLKEGWDVKNVYVICSMRASVSAILTEQTLGRGLRLPYGKPTGIPSLDTLEVVAHERYDALVKRIDKVRERFVDYRTVAAEAAPTEEPVEAPVAVSPDGSATMGKPTLANVDDRVENAEAEAAELQGEELHVRTDLPPIALPIVTASLVVAPFSLSEIVDLEPFRKEGRRIATTPGESLRRSELTGVITTDEEGERIARLRRRKAAETLRATDLPIPLADSIRGLRENVANSGAMSNRPAELKMLDRIIEALVAGLGAVAEKSLAAYGRRASEAIIALLRDAQTNRQPTITLSDDIELRPFAAVRYGRKTLLDRFSPFSRGVGYTGFDKSYYTQDWFDGGSTEFRFAELIEDDAEVARWVRLQTKDLPLPWLSDTRAYNPDFVVIDTAETHWLVETKSDDAAKTEDVKAKARAAVSWTTHVSANTDTQWRYLFATESDLNKAKGSWAALKQLALVE